jgi:6-phosphogluconolactonase
VGNFELLAFGSDDSLAQTAALKWLEHLEQHVSTRSGYLAALPGGRIARKFFAETSAQAKTRPRLFDSVHFFWGDERCVPPQDPESNFGLARDFLLAPLAIPSQRFHRIPGEQPPAQAAAHAEAELKHIAPLSSNGQPILDMAFLGMGEDGHVASLFPGEPETVIANPAVYRAVRASKPPPDRVTIGYPALAAAREVWVLASGAGKERALRDSLSVHSQTPLGRVIRMRSQTRIFTDIQL